MPPFFDRYINLVDDIDIFEAFEKYTPDAVYADKDSLLALGDGVGRAAHRCDAGEHADSDRKGRPDRTADQKTCARRGVSLQVLSLVLDGPRPPDE